MNKKIQALQKLMVSQNIDAFVIPSHDEFYSEIVPPHNARLKYISNFSGSNGTAIITTGRDHFLFTDGRYLTQAKNEVDKNFHIIDLASSSLSDWLIQYTETQIVGLHNKLHSINFIDNLLLSIKKPNIKILKENLIDKIWDDRPISNKSTIFKHKIQYAGSSTETKLKHFRKKLKEQNIDTFILNTPESICWLLNIRGNDSEYSPIILSYLLITQNKASIFLNTTINEDIKKYFTKNKIAQFHLSDLDNFLSRIDQPQNIFTTIRAPFWIKEKIPNIKIIQDPSELSRACKNPTEIKNAIKTHNKDSIAITQCLKWIKNNVNNQELSELDIAAKLLEFRKKQQNFICSSFASIVGFKEHSAIIHYHPTAETNKKISGRGLLLIDSGGQYLEGTTDTTRTIAIGTPSPQEIHDFTLVLKGHIQIITAIFPEKTTGNQLDTLARTPLWKEGKDYAHGTGHGVGSFLSVHEGPQSISKNNHIPLKPGMIISIEPGFYKPKKYGIRIENLVYIKKSNKLEGYLEFEILTKVPIDTTLVDFSLLTKQENEWLTNYNKECYNLIVE